MPLSYDCDVMISSLCAEGETQCGELQSGAEVARNIADFPSQHDPER